MIHKAVESILAAERRSAPIFGVQQVALTGLSGQKVIGLLQNVASSFTDDPEACYAEIGVFQGLTLLSVASSNPTMQCFGVDNFAYLNPSHRNLSIVQNKMRVLGVENATLLNMDYEDALEGFDKHIGDRRVGLLFIDGPHDYRSQLMCLQLARPHLHRDAVIVVDDCNYRHIRQANRDFLVCHPEYRLLFEAYTGCHPDNMSQIERKAAEEGWWNGVNVIIADPDGHLDRSFPPTQRSRTLFENEHEVHASQIAEAVPEILMVTEQMGSSSNPLTELKHLLRLHRIVGYHRDRFRNRKTYLNTFSEGLPGFRLMTTSRAETGWDSTTP